MTVYSTELTRLLNTITDTLGRRVAPELPEGPARMELAAVIEQLDHLAERVAWDQDRLGQTCARTEDLASRLGLAPDSAAAAADIDTLRSRRQDVSELLRGAYREGAAHPSMIESVLEFSEKDVQEQISSSLRGGLPS